MRFFSLLFLGFLLLALPASAQYFGRNKVQYENFEFRVFQTEHFEIYYYPEAEEAVQDAARMAERWYQRHSRTFLNAFNGRKAIIFYANDADFQQTNVISGSIGEGTGGVTEGLKQRVIMPLTGSYAETDHVLGHELVHSFQYDIALEKEDTTGFNLGILPLWLIEGTAEYLSIGRRDAHTAMWLRDAALRDDLPTTKQLERDYRYFPYRYGEAYMAYIGGKYGDAAVASVYRYAGRTGVDSAFVYALGITADSLSKEWAQSIKDIYLPFTEDRVPADSAGRLVLSENLDAGKLNLAPSLSPDGRYVAFLSERDLFNVNLFVADAQTGQVIKKVRETTSDPHFDAIRFIASSGTWSPDGRRLAFVTFVQGDNELSLFNVEKRSIERRVTISGVGAMANPAWSPDGKTIAFSGLDGGLSDLYLLDVATNEVRQLTNDRYADMQPAWSPDGRSIVFVTDRGEDGTNFETLDYAEMRLGVYDLDTGSITVLQPFEGAMHHNPQFSRDGRSVFFISDQDGFKDIYRHEFASGTNYRVTYLQTGVSGITELSPAMTVARETGRMMFSVFGDGDYQVFSLEEEETVGTPVPPRTQPGVPTASVLPPISAVNTGLVAAYLRDPEGDLPTDLDYASRPYRPRLKLDYVAPPSIGVGGGGYYGGTQFSGGVAFAFSDMLGNHNLNVVAQANGTFKDIGGAVQYVNLKNRFNWGASVLHIPYLYGFTQYDPNANQIIQQRRRIFQSQASALGAYPLSVTRRLEATVGLTRYGFDYEADVFQLEGQFIVDRDRVKLPSPDAIYFAQANVAFVGDFSNFGFTSPVQGGRFRYQAGIIQGTYNFFPVLADYRRYFFLKPFTFAMRGMHIGNYGVKRDGLTRIGEEYLYSSYYPGFVRGYGYRSFDEAKECLTFAEVTSETVDTCPALNRLSGTRLALASVEIRTPIFGTEQFGLINFPYLPTELSLFADGGLAWTGDEGPNLTFSTGDEARTDPGRIPVFSVGASTRFNVLGYLIFEVFYAYPFQRPDKGAHFGFALSPGW